jgi:hypothetical protein
LTNSVTTLVPLKPPTARQNADDVQLMALSEKLPGTTTRLGVAPAGAALARESIPPTSSTATRIRLQARDGAPSTRTL